ncbi:hypothetical protein [Planctomycetes bacterium TBK1r]
MTSRRHSPRRRGLSIMEVLFAIGVLTIGLMGVAFILPVATNNAAMALQDDRAVEEVNNRIATDLAKLNQNISYLTQAENAHTTQNFFYTTSPPYPTVVLEDKGFYSNGAALPGTLDRFTSVSLDQLPRAFCIDPWFLSSANTLRFNGSSADANGYDRTLFPCYDPQYVPAISPANAIAESHAETWTWPAYTNRSQPGAGANIPARTVRWNTPRFVRLSLPAIAQNDTPALAASRFFSTSGDDLSIVTASDSTLGAGLFVQRSTNDMRSLTKSTVTGRYSSMVMMSQSARGSNSYDAAVVTMKDRRLVTVPGGEILPSGDDLKHQLRPYSWAVPGSQNPPDNQLTFPGEVMGYVTYAANVIRGGGGGEFIFRTSGATYPDVKEGGWICLIRQEYRRDPYSIPDSSAPTVVPPTISRRLNKLTPTARSSVFDNEPTGPLHFAWFQITSVTAGPTLDSSVPLRPVYDTQVAVRGPDWVFHPSQIQPAINGNGHYGPPYRRNEVVPPGATTEYSYTAATGHPDLGTIVVVMPDVISVKQFPFQF